MACDECEALRGPGGEGYPYPHWHLTELDSSTVNSSGHSKIIITNYRCTVCQTSWVHTDDRSDRFKFWVMEL